MLAYRIFDGAGAELVRVRRVSKSLAGVQWTGRCGGLGGKGVVPPLGTHQTMGSGLSLQALQELRMTKLGV